MHRRTPSRALALLLASTFIGTAFVPMAGAETVFLVQVGSAESEAEAQQAYTELQAKYPGQLKGLSYYPREVSPSANESAWRVQAGPIGSRSRAYKLCGEIREEGGDCFVVETAAALEPKPSGTQGTSFAGFSFSRPESPAASAQPAAESETAQAAPQGDRTLGGLSIWPWNWFGSDDETESANGETPASRTNINEYSETAASRSGPERVPSYSLPWLTDDASPSQEVLAQASASAPDPAPQPAQAGGPNRVEVSEAVAVPLSDDADQPDAPAPVPAPVPVLALRAPQVPATPATAMAPRRDPFGSSASAASPTATITRERIPVTSRAASRRMVQWVQLGPFGDTNAALSCWQGMQADDASLSGLRSQTVRSYFYRARVEKTMLRVGPVESLAMANGICDLGRNCSVPGYECRPVSEMRAAAPGLNAAPGSPLLAPPKPGELAQPRRAPLQGRDITAPLVRQTGNFKVQVGSAPTPEQARRNWQMMQSRNPELLGKLVLDIQPARGGTLSRSAYRMRVGSFANRADAEKLCTQMSARQIYCLVIND